MRRWSLVTVLLLGLPAAVWAQDSVDFTLPNAQVGVPYFFDLGFGNIQIPPSEDGIFFSFRFGVSGGTVPPGMTATNAGVVSGTPTAPGDYTFIYTFFYSISAPEIDFSFSYQFNYIMHLTVTGAAGTGLSVSPSGIAAAVLRNSGPQPQSLILTNRGGTVEPFGVAVRMDTGSGWLTAAPASGSVSAFGQTAVTVTLQPGSLAPGSYRGAVIVTATRLNRITEVPVTLTVGGSTQSIQLSQSGVRFQAVQGAAPPPPETLQVLAGGGTALSFQTSATTRSGGNWLTVSPSGGVTSGGSAQLAIGVNTLGLNPGDYYGEVRVSSSAAENSPQSVTVVLSVVAANTLLPAQVDRTGLIFTGRSGGAAPATQTVTVRNPSTLPLNYRTTAIYEDGNNWLTVTPPSGMITGATPASVRVTPVLTGLAPGVYRATVAVTFTEAVPRVNIFVLLIVLPAGSGASVRSAAGCTPQKLLPVFTRLGAGFANPVGWPASVTVTVVDDCGDPMLNGSVQATFSNGDPPLSLLALGEGSYSATWQPQTAGPQTTITVNATQVNPSLAGKEMLGGTLNPNPSVPQVSGGGVVSAASFAAFQPVAPGGFVSIFGAALSDGLQVSPTVPYGTVLGRTNVLLGARELPLQFTTAGQVNAIIPFDVPANTTQQMVVINGPQVSLPQTLVVAAAQPAIFSQNLQGSGPGIVAAIKPDGTGVYPLTAANRATAGDVLVIYAAGLGTVSPAVPAGTKPTEVSQTTNPVALTIGGVDALVVFAGLSPEFPGVYQVNAVMPSGVAAGVEVPLVLTVAGQSSPPVTITAQ